MIIPFNILFTLSVILSLILVYLWLAYNSFIVSRNQVKVDFADIDVQLKRRASLIENLVAIVKEYAKHEKDTFVEVAKARSALDKPHGPGDVAHIDNMLTSALRSLFAVSEQYPDLKASTNFQRLQDELKDTEDRIAHFREEYNESVKNYNTKIQVFPNVLVASLFGFNEEEMFTSTPSDRESVAVKTS